MQTEEKWFSSKVAELPVRRHYIWRQGWDSNPGVTVGNVKAATRNDPILSRILRYTKREWPTTNVSDALQPFWNRRTELIVEDNCLMWGVRVIVPQKLREQVLQELHQSHPGMARMKALATCGGPTWTKT